MLTLVELLSAVACSVVWINCAWGLSQALGNGTINLIDSRIAGPRMSAARATMPVAFWSYVALRAGLLIVLGLVVVAALYLACAHGGPDQEREAGTPAGIHSLS